MSKGFEIKNKVLDLTQLLFQSNSCKIKGGKVGFTNGCFDILHRGHISYLEEAKKQCDLLIVGINSDTSIKQLNKGDNRPINNENDRAFVLAGMGFIDFTIIFSDSTPIKLIEAIKPDLLFKGGDYDVNEKNPSNSKYIVGSDLVNSYEGKVITIPFVEGYSTTSILEKSTNH